MKIRNIMKLVFAPVVDRITYTITLAVVVEAEAPERAGAVLAVLVYRVKLYIEFAELFQVAVLVVSHALDCFHTCLVG